MFKNQMNKTQKDQASKALYNGMVGMTEIIDTSDSRIQRTAARILRRKFGKKLTKLNS